MKYKVLHYFSIGKDTAVTLDAYGIGVDMKKPLIGDDGKNYEIIGVGLLAGEDPHVKHPLDLLVRGKINCKNVAITEA